MHAERECDKLSVKYFCDWCERECGQAYQVVGSPIANESERIALVARHVCDACVNAWFDWIGMRKGEAK